MIKNKKIEVRMKVRIVIALFVSRIFEILSLNLVDIMLFARLVLNYCLNLFVHIARR